MEIRVERPDDVDAIRLLIKIAFAPVEHSSHTEGAIVDALRAAGALTISLVAVADGIIVGHVAFSPVAINATQQAWYGLGPVAVHPNRQRTGIGAALIREGLARLRQAGARGCVVLGDPAYYRRFGFETDFDLRYEGAPAEYFMRLAFDGAVPSGQVTYHAGFEAS